MGEVRADDTVGIRLESDGDSVGGGSAVDAGKWPARAGHFTAPGRCRAMLS
jgi:hypothetical protein